MFVAVFVVVVVVGGGGGGGGGSDGDGGVVVVVLSYSLLLLFLLFEITHYSIGCEKTELCSKNTDNPFTVADSNSFLTT